jgi:hypothetical protein
VQNDTDFVNKILIDPYTRTISLNDQKRIMAELVKLGFDRTDLTNDKPDTSLIEKGCLNPRIICCDTLEKYERIATSLNNENKLKEGKLRFNDDGTMIPQEYSPIQTRADFIEEIYKKKICNFKIPIISKNGRLAILEYFIECGFMCGHGGLLLLEFKNDKWIRKRYMLMIMS